MGNPMAAGGAAALLGAYYAFSGRRREDELLEEDSATNTSDGLESGQERGSTGSPTGEPAIVGEGTDVDKSKSNSGEILDTITDLANDYIVNPIKDLFNDDTDSGEKETTGFEERLEENKELLINQVIMGKFIVPTDINYSNELLLKLIESDPEHSIEYTTTLINTIEKWENASPKEKDFLKVKANKFYQEKVIPQQENGNSELDIVNINKATKNISINQNTALMLKAALLGSPNEVIEFKNELVHLDADNAKALKQTFEKKVEPILKKMNSNEKLKNTLKTVGEQSLNINVDLAHEDKMRKMRDELYESFIRQKEEKFKNMEYKTIDFGDSIEFTPDDVEPNELLKALNLLSDTYQFEIKETLFGSKELSVKISNPKKENKLLAKELLEDVFGIIDGDFNGKVAIPKIDLNPIDSTGPWAGTASYYQETLRFECKTEHLENEKINKPTGVESSGTGRIEKEYFSPHITLAHKLVHSLRYQANKNKDNLNVDELYIKISKLKTDDNGNYKLNEESKAIMKSIENDYLYYKHEYETLTGERKFNYLLLNKEEIETTFGDEVELYDLHGQRYPNNSELNENKFRELYGLPERKAYLNIENINNTKKNDILLSFVKQMKKINSSYNNFVIKE